MASFDRAITQPSLFDKTRTGGRATPAGGKATAPTRCSTDAVALFSYVFSMSMVFASFVVQEIVLLACHNHLGPKPGPLWAYFSLEALLIIGFMSIYVGLLGVVALSAPLALVFWGLGRLKKMSLPSIATAGLLAAAAVAWMLTAADEFSFGGGESLKLGWPIWKTMFPALCGALAYWRTGRRLSR